MKKRKPKFRVGRAYVDKQSQRMGWLAEQDGQLVLVLQRRCDESGGSLMWLQLDKRPLGQSLRPLTAQEIGPRKGRRT